MVTACNRYVYLNNTLSSFMLYYKNNENNIVYTFVFIDQGTPERYYIKEIYSVYNAFFINPQNYQYSFNILFSYIYFQYTFILEEDWLIKQEVNNNVNQKILESSIIALSLSYDIYGIILRKMVITNASRSIIFINNNPTKMIKLNHPFQKRNFLNGPTIYKSRILKLLHNYDSEYKTGLFFLKHNYYLAFIHKINDANKGIIFQHIGINSTKLGICNIYLY